LGQLSTLLTWTISCYTAYMSLIARRRSTMFFTPPIVVPRFSLGISISFPRVLFLENPVCLHRSPCFDPVEILYRIYLTAQPLQRSGKL
jgi:hypothetical protein